MKNIKILLSITILITVIVIACKKNETSTANDHELTSKYLRAPNGDLVPLNPSKPLELQKMELFTGYSFSEIPVPSTENEAATLVIPLMNNSKQFFYDMGLSKRDLLEEFDSLDDYKIAYVAFAMQAIDTQPGGGIPGCNAKNKIVRCMVQSFIPCSILDFFSGEARDLLMSQGFKAGFNALSYAGKKNVVRILATSAGRMFGGGGLGLTLFVYDFGVCLLTEVNILGKSADELVEINNGSKLLQIPLSSSINYFITAKEVLEASSREVRRTPIFFNSADNKYYSDNTFTTFVPNGYYPNVVSMQTPQCHHIVDGVAIAVYHMAL